MWKISFNSTASDFVYRLVHHMNIMNLLNMVKTRGCERAFNLHWVVTRIFSRSWTHFCRQNWRKKAATDCVTIDTSFSGNRSPRGSNGSFSFNLTVVNWCAFLSCWNTLPGTKVTRDLFCIMAQLIDETRVMTWHVNGVNWYWMHSSSNLSRAAEPMGESTQVSLLKSS